MKIYVVGSTKNRFFPLNNIRQKFLIDQPHEGDNIDFMNPWFCEMTGLYHLWKNCNDDIVGLEHYRRCFVNNRNQPLSEQEISELLKDTDILCTKSWEYKKRFPVRMWAIRHHKDFEFEKFMRFAKQYIGEDYYNCCREVYDSDHHILCNMLICRKEILDEYCKFIFDLTITYFDCEKSYNRIPENRIIGYFTEFFFRAWCLYANKKYKFIKMRYYK